MTSSKGRYRRFRRSCGRAEMSIFFIFYWKKIPSLKPICYCRSSLIKIKFYFLLIFSLKSAAAFRLRLNFSVISLHGTQCVVVFENVFISHPQPSTLHSQLQFFTASFFPPSLHFLQRPDVCCCGSITLLEIKKRIFRRLVVRSFVRLLCLRWWLTLLLRKKVPSTRMKSLKLRQEGARTEIKWREIHFKTLIYVETFSSSAAAHLWDFFLSPLL